MRSPDSAATPGGAGNAPAAILARHGRSFHWASTFLSEVHAHDAAVLYAFCRYADDLVDEQSPEEGRTAMSRLRLQIADESGDRPKGTMCPVHSFVRLMRRRRIDPAVVNVLLETLQRDAGPVRIHTWDQLLRYAYGVASTVGLMMCDVLGPVDRRARPFAIDLGIGMQLTNVARDVLEDAERDRVYLPLPNELRAEDVALDRGDARDKARVVIDDALAVAARYYRSADRGLRYLPRRARCAILAASRIYEGIGAVIRGRRGADYWDRRCYVDTRGKAGHTLRALTGLALRPQYWKFSAPPVHDAELHRPLRGLPAVHTP